MGKSWLQAFWIHLTGFGCQSQIMVKIQTECPIHAMLCDLLPKDFMALAHDHTKKGIPDNFSPAPYYVVVKGRTRNRGNWTPAQHGWAMGFHRRGMTRIKTSHLPSRILPWLIVLLHKQSNGWIKRCVPLTCKYCNISSRQLEGLLLAFFHWQSRQHHKPCF